jgi:hypothetical protein
VVECINGPGHPVFGKPDINTGAFGGLHEHALVIARFEVWQVMRIALVIDQASECWRAITPMAYSTVSPTIAKSSLMGGERNQSDIGRSQVRAFTNLVGLALPPPLSLGLPHPNGKSRISLRECSE